MTSETIYIVDTTTNIDAGSGDDILILQAISSGSATSTLRGGSGYDILDASNVYTGYTYMFILNAEVPTNTDVDEHGFSIGPFLVEGIEEIIGNETRGNYFSLHYLQHGVELHGGNASDHFGASIAHADTFYGHGGDDNFDVSQGDNAYGGEGDDLFDLRFWSGAAPRTFVGGGAGSDTIDASFGSITDLRAGTVDGPYSGNEDTIYLSGIENVTVSAWHGYVSQVYGDDNDNRFDINPLFNDGSAGVIFDSRGGNDMMRGSLGDDTLIGGSGDDVLLGSDGVDYLYGGIGRDELLGGDDNDIIYGDEGNDILAGQSGVDELFGGGGHDTLSGGIGIDYLFGGDGIDSLDGGSGNDFIDGGDDGDILNGLSGSDSIQGGLGRDSILGGNGFDLIEAGYGFDTVDGGLGHDTIFGGSGEDVLYGNAGSDDIYGGASNDRLEGQGGNDELFGGNGADALFGGGSHDTLEGGNGDDVLTGGRGADDFVFVGSFGNDTVTDFLVNVDDADFSGFASINSFAAWQTASSQAASHVITSVGTNSVTFENVALGAFDAADFIF